MPNIFQRPARALSSFAKFLTPSQQDESTAKKTKRKSRGRALFQRIAEASSVKDHSRIISADRDWRNLSPMEPPLPNVSPSRRVGFSHAVKVVQNLPADMTDLFKRPPPTTRQRDSTGSLEDFLYTIPEEDEVVSDDIEESDVPDNSDDASPPKKSLEPQFKPILIGNEKECKRKFAKMLHAAYKFQQQQDQLDSLGKSEAAPTSMESAPYARKQQNLQKPPREMEVLFNQDDNVEWVKFKFDLDEEGEYRRFQGNQVDVWVLGISLYKMLVGRYPFAAPNDKQLFKKMLTADFSIPEEFSDNVKDLLRRLLAPDSTRASLDLIIFHPWLKPYQIIPKENTPVDAAISSSAASPSRQLIAKRTTNANAVKDSRDSLMEAIAEKRMNSNVRVLSPLSGRTMEPQASPLQKEVTLSDSPNASVRSRSSVLPEHDSALDRSSSESNEHSQIPENANEGIAHTQQKKRNRRSLVLLAKALSDAFSFVATGPYAPPRNPYEDLVHLGRNEEEQAMHERQQQVRRSWRSYESSAVSV
ncbi:hypothetical protein INT43_007980, partial [Umbelopsis isabellina]